MVLLPAAALTCSSVVVAWSIGERVALQDPHEPGPCYASESNATFTVGDELLLRGEVRPSFVAWESSQLDLPTFVLYEDGSWLRNREHDSYSFVHGQLEPSDAEASMARVRTAELEVMRPGLTLIPSAVDLNVARFCVRRNDLQWACVSADGLPAPPHPSAESEVALIGQPIPEVIPPPLQLLQAEIARFDTAPAAPFSPAGMELRLVDLSRDTPSAEESPFGPPPTPVPWPRDLPVLDLARLPLGGHIHQPLSFAEAERIVEHLEAKEYAAVRVRDRLARVEGPMKRLPSSDYLHALRARFVYDILYPCLRNQR